MKEIKLVQASKGHLFGWRDADNNFHKYSWVSELPYIPVLVNDAYWDEYDSTATYNLWFGSANSAKSHEKAMMCLWKAHTYPKDTYRLLYCRKTEKDIEDSQFQLFKDLINLHGLQEHFLIRKQGMVILSTRTGNFLFARGLDNIDKIKSISGVTEVWLEEPINKTQKPGANIEREDFQELDRRLRTTRGKLQLSMTFNPMNPSNWIYEDFFDPETRKYGGDEVRVLNTTWRDNAFNSKKIVDTLANRQTGNDNIVYNLGQWGQVKTGLEWIDKFESSVHVQDTPFVPELDIWTSYDFNVVPYMTNENFQIRQEWDLHENKWKVEIRCFREYCFESPRNASRYCGEALISEFLTRQDWIGALYYCGDASGENRVPGISNAQGGPVRAFNEVRQTLRNYLHANSKKVITQNPPLLYARQFINDVLAGKYDISIRIDPSCKRLIQDLINLKDGINGFKKEIAVDAAGNRYEKYGHAYSALVYFLAPIFEQDMYKKKRK